MNLVLEWLLIFFVPLSGLALLGSQPRAYPMFLGLSVLLYFYRKLSHKQKKWKILGLISIALLAGLFRDGAVLELQEMIAALRFAEPISPGLILPLSWAVICFRLLAEGLDHGTYRAVGILWAMLPAIPWLGSIEAAAPMDLGLWLSSLGVLAVLFSSYKKDPLQRLRLLKLAILPVIAAAGISLWITALLEEPLEQVRLSARKSVLSSGLLPVRLQNIGFLAPQNEVSLRNLSPPEDNGQVLLTITVPRDGAYYLRGQDYDEYTGTGWRSTPGRQEDFDGWGQWLGDLTVSVNYYASLLYTSYYPGKQTQLRDGHLRGSIRDYTISLYSEGSAISVQKQADYLKLPEQTLSFARKALEGVPGNPEAIGGFVRSHAAYDLQTPAMPARESDFVQWFLESSDTGYCTHFATACAVLLRSAGIPSRYVTGFLVTAAAGEPTPVTEMMAHAWVEYYNDAMGRWEVLDATPSAEPILLPEPEASAAETSQAQWVRPSQSTLLYVMVALGVLLVLQSRIRIFYRRARRGFSTIGHVKALYQEAALLGTLLKEPLPDSLSLLLQQALYSQYTLTEYELEPFPVFLRQCIRRLKRRSFCRRFIDRVIHAAY